MLNDAKVDAESVTAYLQFDFYYHYLIPTASSSSLILVTLIYVQNGALVSYNSHSLCIQFS